MANLLSNIRRQPKRQERRRYAQNKSENVEEASISKLEAIYGLSALGKEAMSKPTIWYFGNLYWRGVGGKDRAEQIFINDRNGILNHAALLAKNRKDVRLKITGMYYNEYDFNEYSTYEWYEMKDGQFIKTESCRL